MRISTDRGTVAVETADSRLELSLQQDGQIIRIRDLHSGQAWDVDARHYRIVAADHPEGLAIELPGRGTLTLHRQGGDTVTVTTGPREPHAPTSSPLPDAADLANRLSAADALKHADVSPEALAFLGDGDPTRVSAELVAVFGNVSLRCLGGVGQPALSADGTLVLLPCSKGLLVFDAATGSRLRLLSDLAGADAQVALSPDLRTLAVIGTSKYLELWDFDSGHRLRSLSLKDRAPNPDVPVFSADGRYVAVGSRSARRVRVWEVDSGRPVLVWNKPNSRASQGENVESVAIRGDGRLLAVGCTYDHLYFFERTDEGLFEEMPPDRCPYPSGRKASLSPDSTALAVDSFANSQLLLCDAEGTPRHAIDSGHCDRLFFTPDSKTLVVSRWAVGGLASWAVTRFDVATGRNLTDPERLRIDHDARYTISADGRTVALVKPGGRVVRLLEVDTGQQRLPDPVPDYVGLSLAFSPDGRYLVSSNAGPVVVWDLATGRVASTWETSAGGPVAFSRDGRMLTLLSSDVEWWRFPDGQRLGGFYPGLEYPIRVLALSPDGKRLAAGGADQIIWVWNTEAGRQDRILSHGAETDTLTFSPDGRFLLTTTGGPSSAAGYLMIWDLEAGVEQEPKKVEAWAQTLAFLPDGRTVAGLSREGAVWLRDGFSGKLKDSFAAPEILAEDDESGYDRSVALSPGGRLAAMWRSNGPLVIWQPGTNPLRQRLLYLNAPGDYQAPALTFSPDGRYLAATHPEGLICLFRLAERGQLPELPGGKD